MQSVEWYSAAGSVVRSPEGPLIDFTSGVILANLGHAHPAVLEAVREQLDGGLLHAYSFPFEGRTALTREILEFCAQRGYPRATRIHFAVSGAEAIEVALRAAARHAQRKSTALHVATFRNAFHGKTLGACVLSDIERYRETALKDIGFGVHRLTLPIDDRSADAFARELLQLPELSAIFLEVVQGSTLESIFPPAAEWLAAYCKRNDVIIVVDEIQTGFYRTGAPFAFSRLALEPRILCLGKGLTSSLPLGALVYGERDAELIRTKEDASTHAANPLSVAAARGCLRVYSHPDFERAVADCIAAFRRGVESLGTRCPSDAWIVKGAGMLSGVRFREGTTLQRFVRRCLNRGLLLPGGVGPDGNLVKLTPPLTTPSASLSRAFEVLKEALTSDD